MDGPLVSFEHDTNNNATIGKSYSLRPRAATRRDDQDLDQEDVWKPRGRSKKKPKQKSAPLSKYRRKSANARERYRMREINEAFEALRRAIPHLTSTCENPSEKMTKISTLRMAMKYITALSNALQDADVDSDADSFFSEWTTSPDTREVSTPSSINDHFDLYDQFLSLSSSCESSPSVSSPSVSSPLVSSPSVSSPYGLSTLLTPKPSDTFPLATSKNIGHSSHPLSPFNSSKQDPRVTSSAATGTLNTHLSKGFSTPLCSADLEDFTYHLVTPEDLQNCSPSLLDELDIPPPSVDFGDYLMT